MATATDAQTTDRQISEENVIMSGMLTKQGKNLTQIKLISGFTLYTQEDLIGIGRQDTLS